MTKEASHSLFPTDVTLEQWEDALKHLNHLSADDLRSYELVELEGGKKHTLAMVVASKLSGNEGDKALKVLSAMIDKMPYDDLKKQGSDGKTLETVLTERMNGENSQNIRTVYDILVKKINSTVISDDEMDDFLEANSSEIAEASQNEDFDKLNEKIQEIEEREARLHEILKKTLEYYSKRPSGEAEFVTAVTTLLPMGVESSKIAKAAETTFQSYNKYKNTDGNALTRILNRFADAILSAFGKSTKIDEFLGNLEGALDNNAVNKVYDPHPGTERSNPQNFVDRLKENLENQKDKKGIGADKPISVI